ncbi:MAG: aspartate aminotransferase family protein [Rhodospirillales bacterium]|nr:aspartate aminotransferase family protein [Rhodospirillales bacterium]
MDGGVQAERNSYPEGAPNSRALHERAKRVLPGGNTRTTVYMRPFPLYAARGEGCRIWDVDGVARIDCINNFTALIHGHAHPALVAAAAAQLPLGTAFAMPTESEIALAELLAARVPHVDQLRFCNSGTEAVMMAIKAARAFTGRPRIAKVEGAYHGTYDYAEVSLNSTPQDWGGNRPNATATAHGTPESVLAEVVPIPFNNPSAAASLIREAGASLAAVLVDPMPNRAGLVPATAAYIAAIQQAAHDVGALLIFDEVISFRLGYHGAQGLFGAAPDLTAFGKIMGGGFPVGAVGGRAEVMTVFDPSGGHPALPHGGTFSANPVTMRAGHAAMELLDHAAFERLDAMGERVREGFRRALRDAHVAGQVTGLGSLLRVHLIDRPLTDYRSAWLSPAESARLTALHRRLLNHGVIAADYALMALSTPMTDSDLDQIVAGFAAALRDLTEG